VVYVLAALFPPLTLLWCGRPWLALLTLAVLIGLVVGVGSGVLREPLPTLLAGWMILLAVGAVARRRAGGRAARRIRAAWGPRSAVGT
jgi:hypothetical protein